ncbi:MAG TPA: FkbM family methyltransferase [Vicinamibacterales bacterium]|nr:FkbM family methyltransferase [Vicinamibacterales bacterium]
MKGTLRRARRKAGAIRRRLFESPEQAAWRRAWHRAETTPRFTPGRITMMEYDLQYSDLLSFCPQWQDIFVKRTLDFETTAEAPRILDCGANIGVASLFFRRRYPAARITAFEADPALFAMLDANLAANRALNVDRKNVAVWTSNGSLTFRSEGSDSGMIESLPGAVDGRAVIVPSVRLRDAIAAEPAIDLLKLDVEGAEDAVLADCEPVLDRVRALVMDLHEFDPAARQAPRVLELLARAGFTYAVDEFVPLTWRQPIADARSPFPGRALAWAMTVRAWRAAK